MAICPTAPLHLKTILYLKVVKIDWKIIISFHYYKSWTHSVGSKINILGHNEDEFASSIDFAESLFRSNDESYQVQFKTEYYIRWEWYCQSPNRNGKQLFIRLLLYLALHMWFSFFEDFLLNSLDLKNFDLIE